MRGSGASLWGRELVDFWSRPRAVFLKLAYPLVVGVPLLFSSAPPFYAAMALTMLASTLAALGTGSVLARERATGMQLRLRLLPLPAWRQLLERIAAAAAIDVLQVLPLLLAIGLLHPGERRWWPPLAVTLVGTVFFCNAVGALASTFAGGAGEVMLFALLPLLPAFYLSGLFAPPQGPVMTAIAEILPFSHLRDALNGALGGAGTPGPAPTVLFGFAVLLAGGLLCAASGRRVLEVA